MDKCIWLLSRPDGVEAGAFRDFALDELDGIVGGAVRSALEVTVTIQEPDVQSVLVTRPDGTEQPLDVALEVVMAERYVPLDEFNTRLRGHCGVVQGWRVHPTVMYDASRPRAIGESSERLHTLVFIERLDGTTPEHFDRNWFVHGGHDNGEEALDDQSRANRQAREAADPGMRYIQNRILEPLTPTTFVTHGYTQLYVKELVPAGPLGGTDHVRRPLEVPFDRWPPRILQGYEYRVR
ncbi:MAG: hypothetical protein ACHQIG_08330 [Acidimicrobiia bacterium]